MKKILVAEDNDSNFIIRLIVLRTVRRLLIWRQLEITT